MGILLAPAVAMRRRTKSDLVEREYRSDLQLIEMVCEHGGSVDLIHELRSSMDEASIVSPLRATSTRSIVDWLIEVFSYQGISDSVARKYLDEHDGVSSDDIASTISRVGCELLTSYWAFDGCGYRKDANTCANQTLIHFCPLPAHDLRNGRLNQTAYALFLFARDIAGDDLVGWIDGELERASQGAATDQTGRWATLRKALLDPLRNIFGVGDKVLSMALSDLLLGAGDDRPLWQETGVALIAIDTLVHNWLRRTGVMGRWGHDHPYGTRCYAPGGCAEIVERLSLGVDARQFNMEFPAAFPRFVQKAIWSFCAASEVDRCNGTRINDAIGCTDYGCPAGSHCDRRPLR